MIKSPYGLTLGVLALMALGYLGNLAVQLAADPTRNLHANSEKSTDSQFTTKLPGESMSKSNGQIGDNDLQTQKYVTKIKTEMVLIRSELANLNARINNTEFETQTMASRLDRFESSLGPFTASINQQDNGANNNLASPQMKEMRVQQSMQLEAVGREAVETKTVETEKVETETVSLENKQPAVTTRINQIGQNPQRMAQPGQDNRLTHTGSLPKKDWIDRDLDRLLAQTETQAVAVKSAFDIEIKPLPESGFENSSLDLPPVQVASRAKTTQTRFGIHLYSGPNVTDLRQTWKVLRARYTKELGPLKSRFVRNEVGNGKPFQLIAGPFENVLDAVRVCAKIEAGLIRCEQTMFTGQPL
ncbi:MAG: hypothetical protein ACR2OW_03040 [Methyloligellaceae bacterium]